MSKSLMDGFGDFEKMSDDMIKNVEKTDGSVISYADMFSDSFLKANTKFSTFSEMCESAMFEFAKNQIGL